MRIAGMRVQCDNCGKEVFVERKVDTVMDGGYTRLENYKPLQIGWEKWHLMGHTFELCPECNPVLKCAIRNAVPGVEFPITGTDYGDD